MFQLLEKSKSYFKSALINHGEAPCNLLLGLVSVVLFLLIVTFEYINEVLNPNDKFLKLSEILSSCKSNSNSAPTSNALFELSYVMICPPLPADCVNNLSIGFWISFEKVVTASNSFAVGTNGLDHYYEQPFNKLDLVWSNKIGKKWDAKFSIDNILNPKYSIKLGEESKLPITESDLTVKDYTRGVGFSLNVSYTF